MIVLVVANIAFLVLEHLVHLSHTQVLMIEIFDIITALIFIAEFAFEYYFAKDRGKYIRHHWFYLFAAVPLPSAFFEELRAIRLLRLLKLFKIFAHMRYEYNTHLFEERGFRS